MIRCAIYIRVSTEEQHINGLSLPAQKQELTKYAKSQGYKLVDVYADEGFSARKPMHYRKELLRLLEDVKAHKIDIVLVTKLDRWFRNIKDYNITDEILSQNNCYWKTIFEDYDSSTANGQMVINIMLAVNQAECDRTSERIKAVMDYKKSIGEVPNGNCACYGYKIENKRLVKDKEVEHIVLDAYKRYFATYSIRNVISYLNLKYGENAPSANKVDRLFKNEKYCGRWKDNDNYCEPYITVDEFEKIRSITQAKVCGGQYEPYIFQSLIKCPICGNNFTGYRKKQHLKDGTVSMYVRYRCGNKFGRHPSANLSESIIEEYLLDNIVSEINSKISIIEEKRRDSYKRKINPIKLKEEIDRLNIMYQKGRISEDYYETQYKELTAKLSELHDEEKELELIPYKNLLSKLSSDWKDTYNKLDKQHKQVFWKSIIKEIDVNAETHKISGFKFNA